MKLTGAIYLTIVLFLCCVIVVLASLASIPTGYYAVFARNSVLKNIDEVSMSNSNHPWAYYPDRFHRIYISNKCKFIYFTTLKTASRTTRKLIGIKQCGLADNLQYNTAWHLSCGDHECSKQDFKNLQNETYFSIIFTRDPIARFVSLYNSRASHRIRHIVNDWYLTEKRKHGIVYQHIWNITDNDKHDTKYLYFIKYVFENVMDQRIFYKKALDFKHLHPMYLTTCIKEECFIPSFLGKVEHLNEDMIWIKNTKQFGVYINLTKLKQYKIKYQNNEQKVAKNVTYKYIEEALFPLCRLYWNDFMCAHYAVPTQCQIMNNDKWHFPNFCVNLKDEKIEWAVSNNYSQIYKNHV